MMRHWMIPLIALTLLAETATAEEVVATSSSPEFGVGARIGGYGFRDVDHEKALNWEACRMNGTGLFGTVDIARYFFGELSFDLYHSIGNDWDMDRVSVLPAAAVGARLLPGKLITPYVQAGGGPEFTRIGMNGVSENMVLPTAFMGVGGELNIKSFHFGTTLKVFSMGLPEYVEPAAKTPDRYYYPNNLAPQPEEIAMRNEVAAQMQFFARYTF